MNMANKTKGVGLIAGLAFSLFFVAGCEQAAEMDKMSLGEVSFDVIATNESDIITRSDDDVMTKTEYSGKDETGVDVNSSSATERIDWLDTDMIKILCQQAQGDKDANFSITPVSTSGATSNATITPADHKLYWNPNGGDHYFFGLYPSPYMKDNFGNGSPTGATIVSASNGTKAEITATIPAVQKVKVVGNELKPDMAYAYMYAATKATSGNIHMSFKPLMNAIRFTMRSTTAFPSGLTLTKLELSSTHNTLAGTFTATINTTDTNKGLESVTTSGTPGNTITINVPSGVQLKTDKPLMFTFLTMPLEQTDMKLTLSFSDGSTKTLNLKSGGQPITLAPTKKAYINDVGLPWVYVFSVDPTSISFSYTGGQTKPYTVTSYKQISGSGDNSGKVPVAWSATEYSMDNGTTWVTTKPGAIEVFTTNGTGSNSAVSYNAKLGPSPRRGAVLDILREADPKGTQSNPYDLSTHTITGGGISKTTANCYVVSAPGWYKFPLAYGNAYKGGQVNTKAFNTGNTGAYALEKLVKHDNTAITGADISGVSRAELLWQDAENLLTVADISISNGYVIFHVEKENIYEGNAVIAAKNSSGTILWSWHIWVTPYTGNVTMRGQKYQARNLGWCDGGEVSWPARNIRVNFKQNESNLTDNLLLKQTSGGTKTVQGSGPHYQWGRKDPMVPPSGETGTDIDETYKANKVWYNAAGTASQVIPISDGRPQTIGYAIQHPMEMLWLDRVNLPGYSTGTTPHEYGNFDGRGWPFSDWIGSDNKYYGTKHYSNLWNYTLNENHFVDVMLTVQTFKDATHHKTVYDPCPIGYTIPLPTELSNLAKTDNQMGGYPNYSGTQDITWSDAQHGVVAGGNLLPANGMRFYLMNNPHVGNVGKYGYYFSSAYCNAHNGLCLIFGYQNYPIQMTSNFAKGSGRSVRCVPE